VKRLLAAVLVPLALVVFVAWLFAPRRPGAA
jgi:hypothetical protein